MTDNTQPEAVGAGGAQALSAAPGEQLTREQIREVFMANGFTVKEGQTDLKQYVYDAAYALLELVAAPPAEQQATKETSGGFHVWRDISTAPKDGSRFVATGHNYGLYSEVRHTCVAQWFRGCWMEASDWNETSELKYLTHWMPLPSPPDDVAAPAEQQAEESCVKLLAECRDAFPIPEPSSPLEVQWSAAMARPEEVPEYVRLCVAAMQAAPKAAPATKQAGELVSVPKTVFEKCEVALNRYSQAPTDYHNAVLRLRDSVRDLIAAAAPQQEAQEPCQTCTAMARTVMMDQVSFDRKPDCYGIRQITDDEGVEEWEDIRTSPDVAREEANDMMATGRGEIYEVVPLWTTPQHAPQPAPAPLSDDAERLEWLLWKLPGDALRYVVGELADTSSGAEFRAAIDTAIAAQGGKV